MPMLWMQGWCLPTFAPKLSIWSSWSLYFGVFHHISPFIPTEPLYKYGNHHGNHGKHVTPVAATCRCLPWNTRRPSKNHGFTFGAGVHDFVLRYLLNKTWVNCLVGLLCFGRLVYWWCLGFKGRSGWELQTFWCCVGNGLPNCCVSMWTSCQGESRESSLQKPQTRGTCEDSSGEQHIFKRGVPGWLGIQWWWQCDCYIWLATVIKKWKNYYLCFVLWFFFILFYVIWFDTTCLFDFANLYCKTFDSRRTQSMMLLISLDGCFLLVYIRIHSTFGDDGHLPAHSSPYEPFWVDQRGW